jgi:PAS domain S-box-containing protein
MKSQHTKAVAEVEAKPALDRPSTTSRDVSDALCRSVLDAQTDLVCRFRPDSTLTFVNEAYCRFWRKTREEMLGQRYFDWLPIEKRERIRSEVGGLRHGSVTHEHEVPRPDGTKQWWQWITQAIVDASGALVELQAVGRDITQHKQTEEALLRAEARTSAILRAIPDLMFVIRRDGTYLDYHARDPELLFAPPSMFLGKTIRDIMPAPLSETFMSAIEEACTTGSVAVVEYSLPLGRELRHFEVRMISAEPDSVLTIVRDTTDAARTVQQNRDLVGRMIASQEGERQRIARELHDSLGQKVALLNIGLDQLARSTADAALVRQLQQLAGHASEIASETHDLSHQLHPSKLQAVGLVGAIRALCRDVSLQSGIDVRFRDEPLPDLEASVSLCLYRITQEALHNVARHSGATSADVALTRQLDGVRLVIADQGKGFAPGSSEPGGLGLVSMRERTGFVGGRFAIRSIPLGGTRIEVQVPLSPISSSSISRVEIA